MIQRIEINSATIRYHQRNPSQSSSLFSQSTIHTHSRKNSFTLNNQEQESKELENQYESLVKMIKDLMPKSQLSKIQKIRVQQWLNKLAIKPTNLTWRKNINFYLQILIQMIIQDKLQEPFTFVPEDGPLPKLTFYDLPYPIRQLYEKRRSKDKGSRNTSQKRKDEKQVFLGKQNEQKSWFNIEREYNGIQPFSINPLPSSQFPENLGKDLQMDFINNSSISSKKSFRGKDSLKFSAKSNKNQKAKIGLHQTKSNYSNKQNDQNLVNVQPNSNQINRKLFLSKQKVISHAKQVEVSSPLLQDTLSNRPINTKSSNQRAVKLLLKISAFIHQQLGRLQEGKQGQHICQEVHKLAGKLNIRIPTEERPELDSSIISENSKAFMKASENIRLKFSQTDLETVQFLQFLHNLRGQN